MRISRHGLRPMCGDGTATAVRAAILASAAIRATASATDPHPALSHYDARLTAGFEKHLRLCRDYYLTGGTGPWWQAELEALDRGIAWCETKLRAHGQFRFALRDFDLVPL